MKIRFLDRLLYQRKFGLRLVLGLCFGPLKSNLSHSSEIAATAKPFSAVSRGDRGGSGKSRKIRHSVAGRLSSRDSAAIAPVSPAILNFVKLCKQRLNHCKPNMGAASLI